MYERVLDFQNTLSLTLQLVHLSLTIQQGGAEKYDPTPRLTTNGNSAN